MMRRCNEPHPERPQTICVQPEGRHIDHFDGKGTLWANTQVQEQRARAPKRRKGRNAGNASEDAKKKIKAIAAGAEPERHVNPLADGRRPPLYRTDDPPTSREAAERYEPKRESAKGRVLAYLRARSGEWVDAPELAAADVGGFAGTRRLRELRDAGWDIETRPKPGATNTWQHRILPS